MKRSTNLQFVLYRGATESYFCFYQNADGTFSRIVHDGVGKSTKVSFLKLSDVATMIYDAALLGYKVADLKAFSASSVAKLHGEMAKGALLYND